MGDVTSFQKIAYFLMEHPTVTTEHFENFAEREI